MTHTFVTNAGPNVTAAKYPAAATIVCLDNSNTPGPGLDTTHDRNKTDKKISDRRWPPRRLSGCLRPCWLLQDTPLACPLREEPYPGSGEPSRLGTCNAAFLMKPIQASVLLSHCWFPQPAVCPCTLADIGKDSLAAA